MSPLPVNSMMMKRQFFCLSVVALAAYLTACLLSVPQTSCAAQETSGTSDQTFDRDVSQATQPVLVDFYADWCGPCRRMAPIVDDFARRHANQLRVYRCNVDQNKKLAARYQIEAIPTFIVFHHGTPVGRVTGASSRESFESTMQRYLK